MFLITGKKFSSQLIYYTTKDKRVIMKLKIILYNQFIITMIANKLKNIINYYLNIIHNL